MPVNIVGPNEENEQIGTFVENFPAFFKPDEEKSKTACKKCGTYRTIVREPKRIIQIDCEIFEPIECDENNNIKEIIRRRISIDKITSRFEYGQRAFILKGVIEYQPQCNGHYVAHILRNNKK